jgi:hypothetical protein
MLIRYRFADPSSSGKKAANEGGMREVGRVACGDVY